MCGEKDIVKFCKLSRLKWAVHVIRQDDVDFSRRVFLSEPGGEHPRGRPRLRWEVGVKEDASKLVCRNWTVVALYREGWRKLLKEARSPPRAVVPLGWMDVCVCLCVSDLMVPLFGNEN